MNFFSYLCKKRIRWNSIQKLTQSLDFYLPKHNIAIECQGIQHFKPSEYFGGDKRYERTVKLDTTKNKLCKEYGINILYYTHYKLPYEYELITNLETLKKIIYGEISKN